jgi:hypothetical protein
MISVSTAGPADGLYQFFSNPTGVTTASADVYVLRGTVALELFNQHGTNLLGAVTSSAIDQWQTLSLQISTGIPDEVVLYAAGQSPAIFYADNASVPGVPEPSSLLSIGLATIVLLVIRRVRGRA